VRLQVLEGQNSIGGNDVREAGNQPRRSGDSHVGFRRMRWDKLRFYALFAWRFIVLQRPEPLFYGIVLTDRCNLECRGCHVSNTGRPDITWDRLVDTMQNAWGRGFRELYFSGGEPMLWHDGEHTIEDAIVEARRIGFFHVHVYTNGTLGLDTSADLVWVSMDGLPGTFEMRRGDHFNQVERAVREEQHPKTAVIYVIDSNTADGIEPFLRWVHETKFPVIGIMFYFHTPYYGRDELFLTAEKRAPIIDRLLDCKRAGLPVINSRAGLLALKSGNWPRRVPVAYVMDIDGEYVCCRASDDICVDCGYAACTEITEFQRLRPSALLGMRRYW
jgi:MoaA/NifB/PqqE/SkfB family radical SAM enzyme